MKKKVLSVICATLVACSLSIPAFAAEQGPDAGSDNITDLSGNSIIDVQIGATLIEESPAYSVDVTWQSMAFTYTDAQKTWSTADHTWSSEEGSWNQKESTITVINHSSAAVDVSAAYEPVTENEFELGTAFKGVTVAFDDFGTKQLQAGDPENKSGVDGDNMTTAKVSVSGEPTENISEAIVGKVTVTVATGTYAG